MLSQAAAERFSVLFENCDWPKKIVEVKGHVSRELLYNHKKEFNQI